MSSNVHEALIDVRKAYRLLADYQRKVLDLVGFIGDSFGRNYSGGYSKYGAPTPRNGQGRLDRWSWDWLTMYFYEFHFGTEKVANDDIVFSVFVVSDTGYYNEKYNNQRLDKRETERFTNPKESETKLIFLIGKNKWQHQGIFSENFNKPEFIMENEGVESDENGKMIFKSYLLTDFVNQNKAEEKLKDFEMYCKENNIDFKLQKKKI